MTYWLTQESDYQQTSGLEFDFGRSGYIEVEDNSGDSMSLPFIWWMPSPYYSYGTTFNWWDGYELSSGDSLSTENLNSLRFVEFTSDDDSDEFYYLVLPDLETDPLIEFDSIYVESELDDPTIDNFIFSDMVQPEYTVTQVEEAELGLDDLVNFQTSQTQVEVPADNTGGTSSDMTSVPESASPWSLVILGILLFATLLKRQFTDRTELATTRR